MKNKLWLMVVLAAASAAVSGCVPAAIGAAGVVAVDQVMEDQDGDDGLF
jgi:hypothetical protein